MAAGTSPAKATSESKGKKHTCARIRCTMKRKTVFVLFDVPEADSVSIKHRKPLPSGCLKSPIIRTGSVRASRSLPKQWDSIQISTVSPASKPHFTRWLVLALALIGGNAQARPNHWLTWKQGVIRSVDPQRKSLTIGENANQAVEVFRWNKGTRLLDQATERDKSGRPIDQGALTSGESVKILFQNERGERVAKRIVINTSDHKPGSKPIQSAGR